MCTGWGPYPGACFRSKLLREYWLEYLPGSVFQEQAPSCVPALKALCSLPFTAEAGAEHPFERQLHTTHVGASGWELHGSSPTARAGKVDQPK